MTMYGLPNLLVDTRLNVSRIPTEMKSLVEQLLSRCLDLGFVSQDLSREVLDLKAIGDRRISQIHSQLKHSKYLHPLTLILEQPGSSQFEFSAKLIDTNRLSFS